MTVEPEKVANVVRAITERDISAAVIGNVNAGSKVTLSAHGHSETFWDHAHTPYMTLSPAEHAHA